MTQLIVFYVVFVSCHITVRTCMTEFLSLFYISFLDVTSSGPPNCNLFLIIWVIQLLWNLDEAQTLP